LKGKNGKYIALQCHRLYQKYFNYLEKENATMPKENKQSFSLLKSQIKTFEEQAERKLHMYSNL
jgi:hypothetical protein